VLRFYLSALTLRRQLGLSDGQIEPVLSRDTFFVGWITTASATVMLVVNLTEGLQDVPFTGAFERVLQSAEQPVTDQIARRSAVWYRVESD
jgi:hypothetical protein